MNDEIWAPVARSARSALDTLGYPMSGECLPFEADPCGGTFAQHCVAYFAVVDHQMEHLGVGLKDPHASEIYARSLEIIRGGCQLESR
jgi:hypothetical protein